MIPSTNNLYQSFISKRASLVLSINIYSQVSLNMVSEGQLPADLFIINELQVVD